jgi:hypothetical protein
LDLRQARIVRHAIRIFRTSIAVDTLVGVARDLKAIIQLRGTLGLILALDSIPDLVLDSIPDLIYQALIHPDHLRSPRRLPPLFQGSL